MALMVKSRRARSSFTSGTKATWSGWRPSEYAPSVRKVVISYSSPPCLTVTVPCCNPVGMQCAFPNNSSTCSGVALVQRSQSCGVWPSKLSRTQPPTA